MTRTAYVLLALLAALVGQASAASVGSQLTLDTAMQWDQQQNKYVDSDVAARDGYYYQVKGPAVAVDSTGTVLVAWEEWSENGNVVGKIGLRTPSGNAVYVTPEQDCVYFAPALTSYDQGKFLLAVTEVPQSNLVAQDYGKLLVYKVDVSNGQITVGSSPVQVADNAAYPHVVYLGSDNDNRYVAIVYERWNGETGDVELQVLKIDTNGNIIPVLSQPLVIAEGVCKDYVKGDVHYFGHARPVASLYQEGDSKYLIVVLTNYSQATPNVSEWGFYGEWKGCKVEAYVVDLPDFSTIGGLSSENVHKVQGSLSASEDTNECPWVCDNVVVYRVGSLWGGMSGDTTIPDINAALIVKSRDSWTFSSDTTIYRRIYTQTGPAVARVYTNNDDKTPYYLAVFADNSGGFGKERLTGVLFRVKDGKIQVIAQYDLTGFGSGYYYYCPTVATVKSKYGDAELVVACYKGDSGSGGHNIGDAVMLTVSIGDPVDEFMSSAAELLNSLTGTVDVVNNAIFNSYSGLKKKVSDLEKKSNELTQTTQELQNKVSTLEQGQEELKQEVSKISQEVSGLKGSIDECKNTVENLEERVKKLERRKIAVSPMAVLAAALTLAAYRRYGRQ
ncbi:hypothetical protein [Methanopyrus kandleri]|uniref:Predicted secreted protein n=2 Tax=Methanopyrus kandleri TaxID=2320 RepID=Q8TV66_METKA|nr:hypothetical protein [Methanopyrus kandleri]AAM02745.1 Predicted secreted protein [Methanopyrus kandleri AV19]HII71005.1 hypothetical protein [Methanopyrus kandleri]